jgi:uncharacterized membrane protein YeaQ/YmgE (transglycosylase-associated protein family)
MLLLSFAPIAGRHIIAWLVIGLLAGLLAGKVVRGKGFGLVGDVLTGLAGAFVGGLVYHAFTGAHASTSFVIELIIALFGAVALLLVERLVFHRGHGHLHL